MADVTATVAGGKLNDVSEKENGDDETGIDNISKSFQFRLVGQREHGPPTGLVSIKGQSIDREKKIIIAFELLPL